MPRNTIPLVIKTTHIAPIILGLFFVSGCGQKKEGPDADRTLVVVPIPRSKPGNVHSEPLLKRNLRQGIPLFERISGERSGLDFIHLWEPRNESEQKHIVSPFSGGGVALGDIDNDGLHDIFLTRPHGGAKLYRNLGGFRFKDITAASGLEGPLESYWPISATFVDIQGDGHLDLYVCGYASNNKLLVNNGLGHFEDRAAELGLDFKGSSVMMSFSDYDRDGDLDAYLLTNRIFELTRPEKLVEFKVLTNGKVIVPEPHRDELGALLKSDGSLFQFDGGQRDLLYRNDNGMFVEVAESAGIRGHSQGLSATWWDYDSDGWVDLYVANDYYGPDHLYRNNGDGTFKDVIADTVPNTPWYSMGSDAGDLDGDGQLDFIASDMAPTTHYKQKVNMGDMNEDGWFLEHGSPRQYMRNAIYLNTGTPRFMEVAHLTGMANTDWTWSVKVCDFDNDGLNDVFFSNGMTRDFFNADLRAELRKINQLTGENRWSDRPALKERNRIYRNRGELAFEEISEPWGFTQETTSFGTAVGDLDGDGDLDMIMNDFEAAAGLYRNTSSEGQIIKISLQGDGANRQGIGAEIRVRTVSGEQVRVLQPVRGYMGCDPAEAVFGLGSELKIKELTVRWPSGGRQTLTDLAAGKSYLITEDPDAEPVQNSLKPKPMFIERKMLNPPSHTERNFNDFIDQPLLPHKLSLSGPAMDWNDVDGNGRPDLFLGGSHGETAQIWLQSDESKLFKQTIPALAEDRHHEDVDAVWFDADNDGDSDLYVVSGGVEGIKEKKEYQDRLYLNIGKGIGAAPKGNLPDMNFSGSCVAESDFDGDKDIDLFVGARVIPGKYPTSSPSRLLLNDGSGRFSDATKNLAPELEFAGMVTDALWSDVDSDDDPDLLLTTEYGPVRYYRNEGGKLKEATEESGLGERLGWWNCIAAGDFDGDGDTDYAVGNFGRNTKYHPTKEEPQLLFYGDFENNGEPNIVEAHLADGQLVPNRGRSCSSGAMPFIAQKFKSFHEFAIADLTTIYTTPKLQGSMRLEANELASGALINDGKGKFEFHQFPHLAQVAPCLGIVVFDADGDENEDIYLSHNFYGPQRETGRMAGGVGLLLRGAGDGSFAVIPPAESGIIIPNDARGVSAIDYNGNGLIDLAIIINSGPIRLMINSRK